MSEWLNAYEYAKTMGKMNMISKAYMVIDLQFGSTGKGLLAGYLAKTNAPDTVVTAWGPNAGHTYIDPNGRTFVHRMLANGVVSPNLKTVLIGPGSVIDPACLLKEIVECRDLLEGKNIVIHPQAAIVMAKHMEAERSNVTIGSTMKGTGAAVIQRIKRDPDDMNTAKEAFPQDIITQIKYMGINIHISSSVYRDALSRANVLQIEGAQGFSLSIYHGLYPYCTSRDVTPSQVMADCAIPFHIKPKVYGTLRTFPIRVANRYDGNGKMIGTSGPGYDDQGELDWSEVGLEPELTTVTQLPRRIFNFSFDQLRQAVYQCAPDALFLNFCNYMDEDDLGRLADEIASVSCTHIKWYGFGPCHNDIRTHEEGAMV